MAEEQEKCPSMDLNKNIEFDANEQKYNSIEMVLDVAVPVKEGSVKSKFGVRSWHLWFAKVDKKKVYWKDEKREELNYSGKVLFFPTDNLNEELILVCSGNKGVKVEITKVMIPSKIGMKTMYKVKKLGGGVTLPNLSKDELAFVEDLKKLKIEEGLNISEDMAISMAEKDYGLKLERAKEVYKLI